MSREVPRAPYGARPALRLRVHTVAGILAGTFRRIPCMPTLARSTTTPVILLLAASLVAGAADARKPTDVDREFTAQEYAAYNRALAEGVTDTTPARLVEGYVPLYPISRALAGQAGTCVLEFDVTPEGLVDRIERTRQDDIKMCDHAVIAMRHWRFQPARRDGKPLRSRHRVPITYSFR